MTFSTKKLARRPEILHSGKAGLGASLKGLNQPWVDAGYAPLSAIAESAASNYIKENKLSLFEGDCLKIMPSIEEKSIDLILCDLPYGITRNK